MTVVHVVGRYHNDSTACPSAFRGAFCTGSSSTTGGGHRTLLASGGGAACGGDQAPGPALDSHPAAGALQRRGADAQAVGRLPQPQPKVRLRPCALGLLSPSSDVVMWTSKTQHTLE